MHGHHGRFSRKFLIKTNVAQDRIMGISNQQDGGEDQEKSDWRNKRNIKRERYHRNKLNRVLQEGRSGHLCEIQLKYQIGGLLKKES